MRNRGVRRYRKFDGADIEIDRTVVLAAAWFHLIVLRAIEWSEFEARVYVVTPLLTNSSAKL